MSMSAVGVTFDEIKKRINKIVRRWEKKYETSEIEEYMKYTGAEVLDEIHEFIDSLKPRRRYWLSEGCEDYAELIQFDYYAVFFEYSRDGVFISKIQDGHMDKKTAVKLAHYIAVHSIIE